MEKKELSMLSDLPYDTWEQSSFFLTPEEISIEVSMLVSKRI